MLPLFLASSAGAAAEEEVEKSDIKYAIAVLEDDQRRQELLTLLKLMSVLEEEKKPDQQAAPKQAPAPQQRRGLKAWFAQVSDNFWRDLSNSGTGLRQSWRAMKDSFNALAQPEAVKMWRPYVLYIFIWGLVCLLATNLVIRKYGDRPAACADKFGQRLRALVKYIVVVTGPNLILIVSILLIPRLSSTAPGVTADMAIGFSFIYSIVQHFFINLSLLYIGLRLGEVLLAPGGQGCPPFNIPPPLARHYYHSWRVFVIYLAAFTFVRETFMEHFAVPSLYTIFALIGTLFVPIYFSCRLIKLKRLLASLAVASAAAIGGDDSLEALANMDVEAETVQEEQKEKRHYKVDNFFHHNWFALSVAAVWVFTLISLINPSGAATLYTGRLFVSIIAIFLSFCLIRVQRHLALNWAGDDSESGRNLIQNIDILANVLIGLVLLFSLLLIWGFPLTSFLENELTRDIIGRAMAIGITLAALVIFIRLSRLATEWLLAVPSWGDNRNWRTMAPLVLTAIRALAIFVGVVVILERLGVNIGPILAGAGILGLAVGMGAQSLVKDLINGVSILLMDTLAVGDYVTVGGKSGTVEAVGLRSIRLRDSVGNLTVVPNSSVDIIINQTRDYSQDIVDFVVPYDADPDAMLKLAEEVGRELGQDPAWRSKLTAPVTLMGVTAFDANGTTIRLKVTTQAGSQWVVSRELRLRLKRRLLQDGIKSTWFGQNVFYFPGDNDSVSSPPTESNPPPENTGNIQNKDSGNEK